MWQVHLAASIVTLMVLLATMLCLGTADLLTGEHFGSDGNVLF